MELSFIRQYIIKKLIFSVKLSAPPGVPQCNILPVRE